MRWRIAAAICAVLTVPALTLAQPAPPAVTPPAPEPPNSSDAMDPPLVGDHWTYESHDEITGELKYTSTTVITDVTPNEIAVRVEFPGYPASFFVYDHSWNLKNSPTWKYTPSDGTGIKLPLTVGSAWKFQGDDLYSARGVSFRRSGSSKVVGEESITTGAGTFDTFKIETSINLRNVNDPTKTAQAIGTTWYAPSVDHWVKRTSKQSSNGHVDSSSRVELVEYGRR
jgi:hypothetical protein